MRIDQVRSTSPALHPIFVDMATTALESSGHRSPTTLHSCILAQPGSTELEWGSQVEQVCRNAASWAIDTRILAQPGSTELEWGSPDSRVLTSFQIERIVEDGAIGIVATVLPPGLGIIGAAPRRIRINGNVLIGTRVDYLLGDPADPAGTVIGVLEVAGRTSGNLSALVAQKIEQATRSPYLGPDHDTYASGCIFDQPAMELRKV